MPKPEYTFSVSVVIPARNEVATVADVVKRVGTTITPLEILVVDDSSSDATAEQAEAAGAIVVRNPYPLGNGATVRRGAERAVGDVVVFLDADGQHPPEDIPKLLDLIDDCDAVVGARTRNSHTSRLRNLGNFVLNKVARWISRQPIDDLTSGFRAVKRRHLYEYLHLFPMGYSYPTTLTLAMMMAGCLVRYVPIEGIGKRVHGESNISPVRDFLRFIVIILRVILLFGPRRVFLPLGLFLFSLSVVVGALQLWYTGGVRSTSMALFLSGVFVACFGALADQIALIRREMNVRTSMPDLPSDKNIPRPGGG